MQPYLPRVEDSRFLQFPLGCEKQDKKLGEHGVFLYLLAPDGLGQGFPPGLLIPTAPGLPAQARQKAKDQEPTNRRAARERWMV